MEQETDSAPKRRFTKEELQALALQDAVNISDRFAREPVLGPTGKGYYKSAGVKGMKEDQAYLEALRKGETSR